MDSVIEKRQVINCSAKEMTPAETSENDDGSVYFDTLSDFISADSQSVDQIDDVLSLHLKTLLNIPAHSSSNEESKIMENNSMTTDKSDNPEYHCNAENRSDTSEIGFQSLDSSYSSSTNSNSLQSFECSEFIPPSDDLAESILLRAENYFSDLRVLKDGFLLRHIQNSKDGYVSVKLVASFRPVKALTKDWRVVQYCLQRSTKLMLNEQKNKVRRVIPVPKFEDTAFAKTVLVFNLPIGKVDSESMRRLLSPLGEINNVTIINPGESLPEIITSRCLTTYKPFIQHKVFAIVEFQTMDYAEKAVSVYENLDNDEILLKVVPLMSDAYKKLSRPSSRNKSKSPGVNLKNSQESEDKRKTNDGSRKRNFSEKKQTRSEKSRQSKFETCDRRSSLPTDCLDATNSHVNLLDRREYKLSSPSEIHGRKTFHSSSYSLCSPSYGLPQPFPYNHRNSNVFLETRNVSPLTVSYPYPSDSPSPNSFRPRYNKSKSLTSSPVQHERVTSFYPFPYYPNFLPSNQHQEVDALLQYQNRVHKSYLHPKSPGLLGSNPHLPPNVIRWPIGPDGTTGFHDKNRRMRTVLKL